MVLTRAKAKRRYVAADPNEGSRDFTRDLLRLEAKKTPMKQKTPMKPKTPMTPKRPLTKTVFFPSTEHTVVFPGYQLNNISDAEVRKSINKLTKQLQVRDLKKYLVARM